MVELQTSFYATALALCAFASLVMKGEKATSSRTPKYLMMYLLLETAGFGFEYLMQHPDAPLNALWLGLLMISSFLVAPCLFLLAKEVTSGEPPNMPRFNSGHWHIVVLGGVLTIPLLHSIYLGATNTGVSAHYSLFIHTTMLIAIVLFSIQVPYYVLETRRLLKRGNTDKTQPQAIEILNLLIVLVVTNWLMSMCRAINCMFFKTGGMAFTIIEVLVTVWALVLILRKQQSLPISLPSSHALSKQRRYERSGLDSVCGKRIAEKLQSVMEHDRLFTDNMITLQSLSHRISEKPHYVSQVINQAFECNFFEWINQQRIDMAKEQLVNHHRKPVIDIAMDCGFNAKSTFNTAFKKYTEQTPSHFRKRALDTFSEKHCT